MNTLLVGFDSAWTEGKSGAIAAVVHLDDGAFQELGPPQSANFAEAESLILKWQRDSKPDRTLVLLDQPLIVCNATGQRPVENLVGASVSRRYGGMQPANTSKAEMFGISAPIWPFLERFGGPADPLSAIASTSVIETYPVLAIIALGWTLPDARQAGRLPKYNPERRRTFSISDWQHICAAASKRFCERGINSITIWLDDVIGNPQPRKRDQDQLDACLCLLVALELSEQKESLIVGDQNTGYIVVPFQADLNAELADRCHVTHRDRSQWLRVFRIGHEIGSTSGHPPRRAC